MKVIILTVTTLVLVSSLHKLQKVSHTQQQVQQILPVLQQKQNALQASLQKVQEQIQQLNNKVQRQEEDAELQIQAYYQGLANERDTLIDIQNQLDLPPGLSLCAGPPLNKTQKKELNYQIKTLNQSLARLKEQTQKCYNCAKSASILQNIQTQQLYLQSLQSQVNDECKWIPKQLPPQSVVGLVNLKNSYPKDNLNAQNWEYGNTTKQRYRMMLFNQTVRYNLTNCPIQFPYVGENKQCVNCPEGRNFLLGQRICGDCLQNYKEDDNQVCIKNGQKPLAPAPEGPTNPTNSTKPNTTKACQPGEIRDPVKGCIVGNYTSICPPSKPVWNPSRKWCQKCPSNTPFYNKTTFRCEVCPQSQPKYQSSNFSCVACPQAKPIYHANNNGCGACPQKTPLYNKKSKKCQSCPQNQKFYHQTETCEICPPSMPLQKDGQCLTCPAAAPHYNKETNTCSTVGGNHTSSCHPDKPMWNPKTKSCEKCPSETYWSNQFGQCIFCQKGEHFDSEKKKCVVDNCAEDQFFDMKLMRCNKNCTGGTPWFNPASGQCQSCKSGSIFNPSNKKCVVQDTSGFCPPDRPVYNQTLFSCQACPQGQIYNNSQCSKPKCPQSQKYNFQKKLCQLHCGNGQILDKVNNLCIRKAVSPQNVGSKNTSQKVSSQPNVTCAQDEVYDSTSKSCKKVCSENQIYSVKDKGCVSTICSVGHFNTETFKCEKCPQTKQYNSATQECECKEGLEQSKEDPHLCVHVCPQEEIWNPNQNKCVSIKCPPGQNFDTYRMKCISCPYGQKYDESTHDCVKPICPEGRVWDPDYKKCMSCLQGYTYNVEKKHCVAQCKAGFSFDGTHCVLTSGTCKSWEIYVQARNLCEQKVQCEENQFYDKKQNSCVEAEYVTSPQNENLIISDYEAYKNAYEIRKSGNQYLIDCRLGSYFSPKSGCVRCPSDHPYFNLDNGLCQDCGRMRYSSEERQCVQH